MIYLFGDIVVGFTKKVWNTRFGWKHKNFDVVVYCRTSHGETHGDHDLQLDVFHIYVSLQEGICFDRFSCGFYMFLPAYIVCPLLHDTEDSHEKGQLQKIWTLSNNSGDTVGISTMFVD